MSQPAGEELGLFVQIPCPHPIPSYPIPSDLARPEIGFVLSRPFAGLIRHNSFSQVYLPSHVEPKELALFRTF